jgi:hypothetical protein
LVFVLVGAGHFLSGIFFFVLLNNQNSKIMIQETGKMHNVIGKFRKRGWYLVYNKPDYVWVGCWCPKDYLPEGVLNIMIDVPVELGTWVLDPDRPIYGYVYSESQGRQMVMFECKGQVGKSTFDHFTDWVYDLLSLGIQDHAQ